MDQRLQPVRSERGAKPWLALLVDTMEKVGRPEFRAAPCDRSVLSALAVQLAQPTLPHPQTASSFSFRN
jgi:hypothetical protein